MVMGKALQLKPVMQDLGMAHVFAELPDAGGTLRVWEGRRPGGGIEYCADLELDECKDRKARIHVEAPGCSSQQEAVDLALNELVAAGSLIHGAGEKS